ncbi:amidohydrolase family protein [Kineosporia sp. A_224]|uniref:amidohydrolase family protein n=1 Tax=Kineosporia sp. A_224 TaxID=1962180 RepID=UPI000B4B7E6B|nr:amidohydrolase family protein [Kineosporia sp. A_224]
MADDVVLRLRGHVLTGPDEADEVGEAWVVGGRVTYTAPTSGTADAVDLEGWVLPGLVDAHCHIGIDADGGVDDATVERFATADRDAGSLLLRDCGSPVDYRWVDGREDLPVVVRAGRHLARSRRYIRGLGHEIEPEDLPAYAVAQAKAGDGWVKLVGDWIDRATGDLAPCWPREALQAAIEAAHAEGARVTAHCFGEDCLPDLVEAGIDCIEHATGLSDVVAGIAAARGVAIVPTLVNIANFPEFAAAGEDKFPLYAEHMRALHARRYDTVALAYEAGVPVFAGTDAGGSVAHGLLAREVAELVRAGMPPTAALDAACWGARSWLGRPGLEEGAQADLVVYAADPREDVGVLAHPARVVLRGKPVA